MDHFWNGRRQTHFKWSGQAFGRREYYDLVMPHAWSRASSRGFTLVEMVIVILIITLLIALLLPSIKKAKQSARYLTCATQQRQIVQALIGYATDNRNNFPHGYGAHRRLSAEPRTCCIIFRITAWAAVIFSMP